MIAEEAAWDASNEQLDPAAPQQAALTGFVAGPSSSVIAANAWPSIRCTAFTFAPH
ncbi:hypothetical protein [uncultured Amnibacterium sp.]|uniref:hypothetical protein n=1 Tax=uncultured Amnibacterium sp. TaxID=1631851 RepID=UPI0035CB9A4D